MSTKVSIVVAAYNVEKYIKRCILSLLNQTLHEIEIIIVNDGSTDSTLSLVNEISQTDQRIKVIHQENAGLSAARNTGILHSTGDYIAFVDGDDYVNKFMYQKLYDELINADAQLALCDFIKIWEDDEFKLIKQKTVNINTKLLKDDILKNFLTKHDEPLVVAWNKLYKLSIIKQYNLKFINKAFFEDVGFMARYINYVKKITCINEGLYYYIQRPGSITKSYNPIIEESSKNTLESIKSFYGNKLYEPHLNAFELRLLLYKVNYSLVNKKSIDNFSERILKLRKYRSILPLKHQIGILLIQLNLYEKVHSILGR